VVRLLELGGVPFVEPFNGMTADTTAFITNLVTTLPVGGPYVYNSIRIQTGANFTMASDTITGNLEIVNGTALFNGTQVFRINGDLRTRLSGVYSQTGATSLVSVLDSAIFAGATSNAITAGMLRLHGAFVQQGGSGEAFNASGSHITNFAGPLAGTAIQPVFMANPGINAGESRFNRVEVMKPGGGLTPVKISLGSNMRVRQIVDTATASDSIMASVSAQLTADSAFFTSDGPIGTVFNNARLSLLNGATSHALGALRWENMNPADIFFRIDRNQNVQATLSSPVFATTPTTGFYVVINQLTTGAPATLNVTGATPATPGTRCQRTGAAGPPNIVWNSVTQVC
jgi:hypothetical protein